MIVDHLFDEHRRELRASAIADDIVQRRGYSSVGRPSNADDRPRQDLKRLGIPSWATAEDHYFPGLLIPLYRPTGERISSMWKPRLPVRGRDGKPRKYAAAKNRASVIDVHPENRDRIVDVTVPLWITEGVKKADSLTSQGLCVAALSGVFNWRSTSGTLGDWEDIPLRGREVVVCFDADARTNPNVSRAMVRLGRWLRSKGVKSVGYLITPGEVNGTVVKGADDFLAAGGTIEQLRAAATSKAPSTEAASDTFTDSRLAETIADDLLDGAFCWASGLGWLQWDGMRWKPGSDVAVGEAVRQYCLDRHSDAATALARGDGGRDAVEGWRSMLGVGRQRAVVSLAKGVVERRAEDFDAHPDLLNTQTGIVDLQTGDLLPHDPDMLMTKVAGASYRADAEHPDWSKALEAMPKDVRGYMQERLGQAVTGHMTPDDALVVQVGGGSNGKSTLHETIATALGDYFVLVSDRALMGNADAHPTELMDLQGARYAVLEETPEARRLDPQRLKRTVGTPRITARHIRQDSVTFNASHSLFLNTNHRPSVEESDFGTWRRLLLIIFPYTFRKPHEKVDEQAGERRGDPGLRDRCKQDPEVQAAALAWLIAGARKWYGSGKVMPAPPSRVAADTRRWRSESDLVLAYCDDRMVMHPGSHVLSTDLLADFNSWLEARGHRAWSDRTLSGRFEGHELLAANKVEKAKIRADAGLSRPSRRGPSWMAAPTLQAPPAVYHAWLGMRFATEADDKDRVPLNSQNEDHVPAVPADLVNRALIPTRGLSGLAGTAGTEPAGTAVSEPSEAVR